MKPFPKWNFPCRAPKKSNLNSGPAVARSSVKLVSVNGRMEMYVQLEKDFIEDVVLVLVFRREQEKLLFSLTGRLQGFFFVGVAVCLSGFKPNRPLLDYWATGSRVP